MCLSICWASILICFCSDFSLRYADSRLLIFSESSAEHSLAPSTHQPLHREQLQSFLAGSLTRERTPLARRACMHAVDSSAASRNQCRSLCSWVSRERDLTTLAHGGASVRGERPRTSVVIARRVSAFPPKTSRRRAHASNCCQIRACHASPWQARGAVCDVCSAHSYSELSSPPSPPNPLPPASWKCSQSTRTGLHRRKANSS